MKKDKGTRVALKKSRRKEIWRHRELYLFMLPALVALIIFSYAPMYGIVMAFQDIKLGRSIFENDWVGLKHFIRFFNGQWCSTTIKNTLLIGLVAQLGSWPVSICLALLLHNTDSPRIKKLTQTASYIPHLLSTVLIVSIINLFCSDKTGLINILLVKMGYEEISFFGKPGWVLPLYVISEIWAHSGYGAIIYLGALSAVDEELMEAAKIDGAGKLKRIWYIQLPLIRSTMVTMLILKMGSLFSMGAEKMLLLQTDLNLSASEIISTYVYKVGLSGSQYGFATAVGMFQNVVNLIMVLLVNWISSKLADTSII